MNDKVRIRADVLAVSAYTQGRAPDRVGFKLSSNENPFGPLPDVLKAVHERTDFNRYPAADMSELRERIAATYGLTADHVHIGSGSVSILYQLVHAVAGPGDNYVFPWPSFEAYPGLGLASGAQPVAVPLADDFSNDLDALADAVNDRTRAVLVCTPNNPTGPVVKADDFARFLSRVPSDVLVIVDEAYAEFVTDPDAAHGTPVGNVVVLKTFSKAYGLASLRIGYGIGDPEIWSAASRVAIPLAMSGPAEAAALASLDAQDQLTERVGELIARRERVVTALREAGIRVPQAQGNFIWLPDAPETLAGAFAERGTLVRPFAGHGVRISIGEDDSIDEVIEVVKGEMA
ncbi:MAG: histidinol-phosphate transaminase [Canibacter sp.]